MEPASVPQTPAEAAPPRLAATVILLRGPGTPGAAGPEVLMLRRHGRSGFAASAWVFPGGTVDEGDRDLPPRCWEGIDPEALAPRFGLDPGGVLAMHVAAARETFEESGVLLARTADGDPPDHGRPALTRARTALAAREARLDFGAFLAEEGLVLRLDALTYWLRWVTPIQEPRRYDTCFFLAVVPEGVTAAHDAVETVETRWITAADALAHDDFRVIYPTQRTLEALAPFDDVASLVAHAAAQPAVEPVQPHIITDAEGRYMRIVSPGEPGYPAALYRQEAP